MSETQNNPDSLLREELTTLLWQGNAFVPMLQVLEKVPAGMAGQVVPGYPHSIYSLTRHIHIALHDLLEYTTNPHFQSPPWPEGYWPKETAPRNEAHWQETREELHRSLNRAESFIEDYAVDFWEPLPANARHHAFRQMTIAITHNAYHAGQIVMLHKIMSQD